MANYTANKAINELSDVGSVITSASLMIVQDPDDLNKASRSTIAEIFDSVDVALSSNAFTDSDQAEINLNTTHRNKTTGNPHSVTKTEIGLSNVPNTDCTNASNITTGTLSTDVLPAITITSTYTAITSTAQLALTVQEGDVCVRTDENKCYIALNSDNVDFGDWQELLSPTDTVQSVNGETGTITLTQDDVGDGSTYVRTQNAFTDTLKSKLDNIEANADVTDSDNVNSAGAVMESDFNATTFLYAAADNTPQPKTIAETLSILSVESGAEVNNISDINATDLTDTGESILHYHASDRNRSNHTGTQLASTISNLTTTITNTKLDDLSTPDDNTDLNVSLSYHGLTPKLSGDNNTYLRGDGTWFEPPGGNGGGGLSWSVISVETTASDGNGYLTDVSVASLTITLSDVPSAGQTVGICDYTSSSNTNNIILDRNGHKIEGIAENLLIDVNGAGLTIVYTDDDVGWKIVSEINIGGVDTTAIHSNINSEINAISTKTILSSGDILIIEDSEDGYNKKSVKIDSIISKYSNRIINNITDTSLTVTSDYFGEALDCSNGSTQTLTIDTLNEEHDGMELYITKIGVGNVVINTPLGVTIGDSTDTSITLVSEGFECRLRYNHYFSRFVIIYSGEWI